MPYIDFIAAVGGGGGGCQTLTTTMHFDDLADFQTIPANYGGFVWNSTGGSGSRDLIAATLTPNHTTPNVMGDNGTGITVVATPCITVPANITQIILSCGTVSGVMTLTVNDAADTTTVYTAILGGADNLVTFARTTHNLASSLGGRNIRFAGGPGDWIIDTLTINTEYCNETTTVMDFDSIADGVDVGTFYPGFTWFDTRVFDAVDAESGVIPPPSGNNIAIRAPGATGDTRFVSDRPIKSFTAAGIITGSGSLNYYTSAGNGNIDSLGVGNGLCPVGTYSQWSCLKGRSFTLAENVTQISFDTPGGLGALDSITVITYDP